MEFDDILCACSFNKYVKIVQREKQKKTESLFNFNHFLYIWTDKCIKQHTSDKEKLSTVGKPYSYINL